MHAQKQIIHYKRQLKKNLPIDNLKDKTEQTNINKKNFLFIAIAILITAAVYLPTFNNTYTNWDDGHYVLENHLIKSMKISNLKKYFFSKKSYERYYMGNYHPLTMITYNLNYLLAKKDKNGVPAPFWFQFTNIFLHIISVIFVFLIIFRLLKNNIIAFLTALFFGIGTMHVESVAWISERKDVLYTAFYLISLYLYILYVEKNKAAYYWNSLLIFIMSLLSKGQAVSLSFSIVLIDIWYERKIFSTKVIFEKIPYFVLSLIFGLIAIEAQKYSSALQEKYNYELYKRFAIAAYGFTMYLIKLIIPYGFSAIYPYPDIINKTVPTYYWLMFIPSLAFIYLIIIAYKKKWKVIFWGSSFFILNIILLLQIIPVGGAIYADRYSYIPSIGIHLIVAWLIYKFATAKDKFKTPAFIFTAIYITFIGFSTIKRIEVWRNSLTLWQDTIKKQPKAVVAWNNLGSEFNKRAQKISETSQNKQKILELKKHAIECFQKAIKLKPDYKSAYYNLGATLFEIAKMTNDTTKASEAVENFSKAIAYNPTFIEAIRERGTVYDWLGKYQNALADYTLAIKLNPNDPKTYVNRAATYGKIGEYYKAIADLQYALKINPDLPEVYSNLGLAYFYTKDYKKALESLKKAIELEPQNPASYFNRSLVYGAMKKYDLALKDINKTIELGKKTPDIIYFKGYYLILLGNKKEGCQHLQTAANEHYIYATKALQVFCNKKQ